jgi:hypothetical protein
MLPGQELAPSLSEGCQWVNEPVSRHFFINQPVKIDFYLAFCQIIFQMSEFNFNSQNNILKIV